MPEGTAAAPRPVGRSVLLTLPAGLWSMLIFSRSWALPGTAPKLAAVAVAAFMSVLFYQMVRTRRTYRWRRIFFVALGFLFPIGFVTELVRLRGSMSLPIEEMAAGDTPFCFMVIPVILIPAALTRTIIFPGSILPTPANPHAVATMIALWMGATLVLGKAWCSFGCFFGGLEEGFAAVARKVRFPRLDPRWRAMPWAVLAAIVLLSAATFSPVYCEWLCPFKTVTEFPEVRNVESAVQAGVFFSLFAGLVVAGPVLTRKRTQCTFFCPFGAFQSLFNKLSLFEVRIDRSRCSDCVACRRNCPTLSLDERSLKDGRALLSCMRCGACVDGCPKGAAVWHVRGTPVGARPETARLLFLYAAWAFATMFGGSILANSLTQLIGLAV